MKQRSESCELARGERIGRANLDVIPHARAWCRHLNVRMESAGLLAEVTGLPVGSHRVTCEHAKSGTGGMNLPWILPEFVAAECPGCPHHSPAGDPSWGRGVLADRDRRERETAARAEATRLRLAELRERLRALPARARGESDATGQQILAWIEQVFGGADDQARGAVARLRGAAEVAPELFNEPAVNALVAGAGADPFRAPCLDILAVLADRRTDLDNQFRAAAGEALAAGLCLEAACLVLAPPGRADLPPPPAEVVARVVALQDHVRPVGGWPDRDPDFPAADLPPDYSASTRLLVRAFDADPELVAGPVRSGLRDDDKHRRVSVCGVAREVAAHRPWVLQPLVDDLLASLELDDDVYGDSADHAACELIAHAFLLDPAGMDARLSRAIQGQPAELQTLTVAVYEHVFRFSGVWHDELPAGVSQAEFQDRQGLALRRCLSWVLDESLELETRSEAVESACRSCPGVVLPSFDTLLGAQAQLALRVEPPPERPRLLIPGEPGPDPALLHLNRLHRETTWRNVRLHLDRALEELVEERPDAVVDGLVSSFRNLDSATHGRFKSTLLTLLGKAGASPKHLPAVLPALWAGLMDFGSVQVRGTAVQAVGRSFQSARVAPPADVVEVLVLHLSDKYKLIHQSTITAFARNTGWLKQEQLPGVLDSAWSWAVSYRQSGRLYEVEDLFCLILGLSSRLPQLRETVVRQLCTLFPNDAEWADRKLLGELVRDVSPREPGSGAVAVRLAEHLSGCPWEPFGAHGHDERWFAWLQRLRRSELRLSEPTLLEAALKAAARNVRVACLFAGLFGALGRFDLEVRVLAAARERLPKEQLFGRQAETLARLEQAAGRNLRHDRSATLPRQEL